MRIGKNGAAGDCAAVVLAGGRSTRMGRSKAELPWGETPLLEHLLGAVGADFAHVMLSVAADDAPPLHAGVTLVRDPVPRAGPLAGIVAALEAMTADWLFVLACDMPFADSAVWRALGERATAECDAVLPRTGRGLEPLCGYYHRRCLVPFRARLDRGRAAVHQALEDVRLVDVPVADLLSPGREHAFTNLNTPEEFAAAWERAAARARTEA